MCHSPDAATKITLRSARPADEAFLYQVYAGTRQEELALVDWDEERREAFLRQQFTAQHRWYYEQYTDTTFDVVLADGAPIGRLYVARWPDEIRIVDIALLPEHRRRGIGSALLAQLLNGADRSGLRTTIHVERFNPARRLYDRLGFVPVAETAPYLFMERPACAHW